VVDEIARNSRELVSTSFPMEVDPETARVSFRVLLAAFALSYISLQSICRFDAVEHIDIPDFEETAEEFRMFQAKESRRSLAREERNRRRKTMLDLERPNFGEKRLTKVDSAACG
jgi:hypothetical protein